MDYLSYPSSLPTAQILFGLSTFLFQLDPQAHFSVDVTRIHFLLAHRQSVSYLTYISINYLQQGC